MSDEAFTQSHSTITPKTPEDGFRRRFDSTHGDRKRPSPTPDNLLHDGSGDSPKKQKTIRSTWESASFCEALNAVRQEPTRLSLSNTRKTTETSEANPRLPPFRELLSSSSGISKEENTGHNTGRDQAGQPSWRLISFLPAPGPLALLSRSKDQRRLRPASSHPSGTVPLCITRRRTPTRLRQVMGPCNNENNNNATNPYCLLPSYVG